MSDAPVKNRKRGLAFKLSLFILASTTMIFLVAFGYNYIETRYLVMKSVEEKARNLALSTVYRIETILRGVDGAPRYMAASLEDIDYSQPELIKQIENTVKLNPDIFGAAVAYEPYAYNLRSRDFCPYYSREKDRLKFSYLGGENYRYHFWDWYILPKELDRAVWSEPYFDEGGLIDDVVARIVKGEGGMLWACKNYDGDVMSDMVASAFGSLAMMTSVLVSPDGVFEYEAAHGTVQKHYYKHLKGEKTSSNSMALIFAWTGALRKRGELDGLPALCAFADRLEQASLKTIIDGVMTGDLARLATPPARQVVGSEEFLDAIAARLKS